MKNTILFAQVDREDRWVSGISVILPFSTDGLSYAEIYAKIQYKLVTKETLTFVKQDNCLAPEMEFKSVTYTYGKLTYVFVNPDDEEEVEEVIYPQTNLILGINNIPE